MHGLSHDHCRYPLKTRWAEKNTSATVVPDEKQRIKLIMYKYIYPIRGLSSCGKFLRQNSKMKRIMSQRSTRPMFWRFNGSPVRGCRLFADFSHFSHGKQRFSLFGFRLMKSWAQWKLCNPWRRNLPLGRIKDSMDFRTLGLVFCKRWVEFAGSCYHKLL